MIRIPCIIEIDEKFLFEGISDEMLEQFKVKVIEGFRTKSKESDGLKSDLARNPTEKQADANEGMHHCEYCGKTFNHSGHNQKFCSVKCRTLNYSQSKATKEPISITLQSDSTNWYKKKLQEQSIEKAEVEQVNETRNLSKIDWELVRKNKKHNDNITIIQ